MVPDSTTASSDAPGLTGSRARMWTAVAGILALFVLLYSLLVVQQVLLGVLGATLLLGLVLFARVVGGFARAYRRRTEALEAIADSLDGSDRTGPGED